jgi:hypothetical protein
VETNLLRLSLHTSRVLFVGEPLFNGENTRKKLQQLVYAPIPYTKSGLGVPIACLIEFVDDLPPAAPGCARETFFDLVGSGLRISYIMIVLVLATLFGLDAYEAALAIFIAAFLINLCR